MDPLLTHSGTLEDVEIYLSGENPTSFHNCNRILGSCPNLKTFGLHKYQTAWVPALGMLLMGPAVPWICKELRTLKLSNFQTDPEAAEDEDETVPYYYPEMSNDPGPILDQLKDLPVTPGYPDWIEEPERDNHKNVMHKHRYLGTSRELANLSCREGRLFQWTLFETMNRLPRLDLLIWDVDTHYRRVPQASRSTGQK